MEYTTKRYKEQFARMTFTLCLGLIATAVKPKLTTLYYKGYQRPKPSPHQFGQEARGVLRAVDQAIISSELNAKVVEMPFHEGESFHKGDLLVRF